jgi:hypothetical protein
VNKSEWSEVRSLVEEIERIARPRGARFIDLAGGNFGLLSVLREAGRTNRDTFWLCRCSCGTEKVVRGRHLRSGAVVSCGCRKRRRNGMCSRGHLVEGENRRVNNVGEVQCVQCRRDQWAMWAAKNEEKVRLDWARRNKERCSRSYAATCLGVPVELLTEERYAAWRRELESKRAEKAARNGRNLTRKEIRRRHNSKIPDSYLVQVLAMQLGASTDDVRSAVTPALLAAKRMQLKVRRITREKDRK